MSEADKIIESLKNSGRKVEEFYTGNKTSDKNVGSIEDDVKRCNELIKVEHANWIGISNQLAISHILAEREQMTKRYEERDDELYERVKQCNNLQTEIDRLYLDKEELIELNRKQARQIQELEAKLEFKKFGDLDNVEFEEYMSQFIPKQVVIDKVNEINKKYEDSKDENGESPYYYPDFTIRVLQKLLGTK